MSVINSNTPSNSSEGVNSSDRNSGLHIEGTDNSDTIVGSASGDYIKGGLGNDTIYGSGKGNTGHWWDDLDTVAYSESLYVLNRSTGEQVKAFDVVVNADSSVTVTRNDLTGGTDTSTDTLHDIGRITFGEGENSVEIFLDQRESVWMWQDWNGDARRAFNIDGGITNDVIQGTDQQDWLKGGAGNDIILADASSTATSAIIAAGGDSHSRSMPGAGTSTSFTVSLGEISQSAFIGVDANNQTRAENLNVDLTTAVNVKFAVSGGGDIVAATAALAAASDIASFVTKVNEARATSLNIELWVEHTASISIDGTDTDFQGVVLLDVFDSANYTSGDRIEGGEGNDYIDGGLSGNRTENTWENNNEAKYHSKAENYELKQITIASDAAGETSFNDGTNISDWWAEVMPTSSATVTNFSELATNLGLSTAPIHGAVYVVVRDLKGSDGIDLLTNIQRIGFSDKGILLDVEVHAIDWRQNNDSEPNGTNYNGSLFGDQITATDGYDEIYSQGGNDLVHTGAGGDRVNTGAGNDYVDGGASGTAYNNRWQDADEVRFDGSVKRYTIDQADQSQVEAFWNANFTASQTSDLSYSASQKYFIITDLSPSFGNGTTLITNVDRINFEDDQVWLETSVEAWDQDWLSPYTAEEVRVEGTQFNDTVIAADVMTGRSAKDLWRIEFNGQQGDDVFIGDAMGSRVQDGTGNDMIIGGGSPVLGNHRWFGQDEVNFNGARARYTIEQYQAGDMVKDSAGLTIYDLSQLAAGTITTADGTAHTIADTSGKVFVVRDLMPDQFEGNGINLLMGVERVQFEDAGINLTEETYENTWATSDENYTREIHIRGTLFDDVINAEDTQLSNDSNVRNWVEADDGNDYIFTGGGGDEIRPGKGNDYVDGGASGTEGDSWNRKDKVSFAGDKDSFIISEANQTQVEQFWADHFFNSSFTYQGNQSYYLVVDTNPVDGYGSNLITNIDRIQFSQGEVELQTFVSGGFDDHNTQDRFEANGTQFNDTFNASAILADRSVLPSDRQGITDGESFIGIQGQAGNDVFIGGAEASHFTGGTGNDLFVGDLLANASNSRDEAQFNQNYSRYEVTVVKAGDTVRQLAGDDSSQLIYDLSALASGEITTADGTVHQVGSHHTQAYVVRDILSDAQGGDGVDLLFGVEKINFQDKWINLTTEVHENNDSSVPRAYIELTPFDDTFDMSAGTVTDQGNTVQAGVIKGAAGNDTVIGFKGGTQFYGGTGLDVFISPDNFEGAANDWHNQNQAQYTGSSNRYQIETGYLGTNSEGLPNYIDGQIDWSSSYKDSYQAAIKVTDLLSDALGGEGTDYLVGVHRIQFNGDSTSFSTSSETDMHFNDYWLNHSFQEGYADIGQAVASAKVTIKERGSRFDDVLTGKNLVVETLPNGWSEVSIDASVLNNLINGLNPVLFKSINAGHNIEEVKPLNSLATDATINASLWVENSNDAANITTALTSDPSTFQLNSAGLTGELVLVITTPSNENDNTPLATQLRYDSDSNGLHQIINSGENSLQGKAGNDTLIGSYGDDYFKGGQGDDLILDLHAGFDRDTAEYAGTASQYTISSIWVKLDANNRISVEADNQVDSSYLAALVVSDTDTSDAGEGRDVLVGIDQLSFDNWSTTINTGINTEFNAADYYPGVNLNENGMVDFPGFWMNTAAIDETIKIADVVGQYEYDAYVSSTPHGFNLTTDSFRQVNASEGNDTFFGLTNNSVWSISSTGDDLFVLKNVNFNELTLSQGFDSELNLAYVEVTHTPTFAGATSYGTNRLYDFDQLQYSVPGSEDAVKLPLALNPSLEWMTYDTTADADVFVTIEDSLFDDVIDDTLLTSFGTLSDDVKGIKVNIRGGDDTVDLNEGSIIVLGEVVDKWRINDGDDFVNTGTGLDIYQLNQSMSEFNITYFFDANNNQQKDTGEAISLSEFQTNGVTIYDGANKAGLIGNTSISYADYLTSHSAKEAFGDASSAFYDRDTGWFQYNDQYFVEIAHQVPAELGGRGTDVLQNIEIIRDQSQGDLGRGALDLLSGDYYGPGHFFHGYPTDYSYDATTLSVKNIGSDLSQLRSATATANDTETIDIASQATGVLFEFNPEKMSHWVINLNYQGTGQFHSQVSGTDGVMTLTKDSALYDQVGTAITTALTNYANDAGLIALVNDYNNTSDITIYVKDNYILGPGNDIIDLGGEALQDQPGAGWMQDNVFLGAPFGRFDISYGELNVDGKITNAEAEFNDFIGTSGQSYARISDKLTADLGGFGINYVFNAEWIADSPNYNDYVASNMASFYGSWGGVDRVVIIGTGADELIAAESLAMVSTALANNAISAVYVEPAKGDDVIIGLQQNKYTTNWHEADSVFLNTDQASFDVERVYVGLADDRSDVARNADGSVTYHAVGDTAATGFQLTSATLVTDQILNSQGGYGTKLLVDIEQVSFAGENANYQLIERYEMGDWGGVTGLNIKGTDQNDYFVVDDNTLGLINAAGIGELEVTDGAGDDIILSLTKQISTHVRLGAGNDYVYIGDHIGTADENAQFNVRLHNFAQTRFDVQTVGVVLDENHLASKNGDGSWALTDLATPGAVEATLITDLLKIGADYGSNLIIGVDRIQFNAGQIQMAINEHSHTWTDNGTEYTEITQEGTAFGERISYKTDANGTAMDVNNRLQGKAGDDTLIGGATGDQLDGGAGNDILIGGLNGSSGDEWRDLDQAVYDVAGVNRLTIESKTIAFNSSTNAILRDAKGDIDFSVSSADLSSGFALTTAYQVSDVVSDALGGQGVDLLIGIEKIRIGNDQIDLGVTMRKEDWNSDGNIDWNEIRGSDFAEKIGELANGGTIDDVGLLDLNNNIRAKGGDDDIYAGAGGDWINTGTGNDFADGGTNLGTNDWGGSNQDEVRFSNKQSNYNITNNKFTGSAVDIKDLDGSIIFKIQTDGNVMRVDSSGSMSSVATLANGDQFTVVQDQTPSGDLGGQGTNLLINVEAISFNDQHLRLSQEQGHHTNQKGEVEHAWLNGTSLDDTLIGSAYNEDIRGESGNDLLFGGDGGDRLHGGQGNDILIGGDNGTSGDNWRDLDQADYWQFTSDRATVNNIKVGLSIDGKSLLVDGDGAVMLDPTSGQLATNYVLTDAFQVADKVDAAYGGFGTDILVGIERISFKGQQIDLLITSHSDDWNQDGVIDWSNIEGTDMADRITSSSKQGTIESGLLNSGNYINAKGGDDDIWAMAGGDDIRPGGGNDYINGGANGTNDGSGHVRKDGVNFSGAESRYVINSLTFQGEAVNIKDINDNIVFKVLSDGSIMRQDSSDNLTLLDTLTIGQTLTQVTDLMPGGVLGGDGVNLMINVEHLNFDGSWMGLEVDRNLQYDREGNLTNSWINGTASSDAGLTGTIIGDSINGNAGDDTLVGLQGSDHFSGGAGNDTIWGDLHNSDEVLTGQDVARFEGLQKQFTISRIESTVDGKQYQAIQVSDILSDDLGGSGTDTLYGIEALSFNDNWVRVGVEVYEHKDKNGSVIERHYNGSQFDDVITGSDLTDSLNGGDGNDQLSGGAGGDHFEGGDGNDTIYGGAEGIDVWGNARVDVARFTGKWSDHTIQHYDSVGSTSNAFDASGYVTVQVKSADNSGDIDTLYGIERLEFSDRNVSFASAQSFTDANGDGIPDWAEIRGTTEADTLDGSDLNDVIYGDAGNDTINGGKGDDTLSGGEGSNILDGGNGSDVFGNTYVDTAKFSDNYAEYSITNSGSTWTVGLSSGADVDTLSNIEVLEFADMKLNLVSEVSTRDFDKDATIDFVHLTGTLGDNSFNITDSSFGDSGWALPTNADSVDYYLDLGAGNDVAVLGSGDDTIFDHLGTDNYDGGDGFDTLQLAGKRADWGEFSTEASDGSRTISDSAGQNTKTLNHIEQVQFLDKMAVLSATTNELDTDADGSTDTMLYAGTELSDVLSASGSQENLSWVLNGNTGDDRLTGGSANDRLNGGEGNDQLSGGDGIDTAVFSALTADTSISQVKLTDDGTNLVEDADNGILNGFKVAVGSAFDLMVDMEVIEFADGLVSLTSSEEVLSSFSLSTGLVDTRYVTGTQFGDTLSSSNYQDEMTGGAGNDTFVLTESSYKTVTVTDFAGLASNGAAQDILQFDSSDDTSLFGISVASWFTADTDIATGNAQLADSDGTNDVSAQALIDAANTTQADIVTNILKLATFNTDTGDASFRFTGDNNVYLTQVAEADLSVNNIDIV
jgi:Ca2+-binding RTX toxin-like protein